MLLDRMISITRELYPSVSDLAREVRYRCYDQPVFEQARNKVYEEAEAHLAYLATYPDAGDSRARIRALTDCPQLLAGLFASWMPTANHWPASHHAGGADLEVLQNPNPAKHERIDSGWTLLCLR